MVVLYKIDAKMMVLKLKRLIGPYVCMSETICFFSVYMKDMYLCG